ncbi:maltose 6'-phosphate phosphatase [Nitrosomonas sp. Nm84]|uniref:endonuclease/exonuclease/phosphatase family protein n=1 Tax=Nitrosomonas sp. Nm84 TaxID=200124 RepID=UPI000D75E2CA|nr:endonuclease/exonuclease/phosphatase family protein [Nitrosomonas sp. Nm84]PXW88395.1 maltose 6'-phosphate phosphatase [Nitrosomonas sp. Nm84]
MKGIVLFAIFSIIVLSGCAKSGGGSGNEPLVQCGDVAGRNHLNILSINLLFKEIETRDQRLDAIAEFAEKTPVDVILLQEVAGGALVHTENSAKDLQKKLRVRKRDYDLYTAFEIGLPGVLGVANAILSRCEIDYRVTKRLPHATELNFQGHDIKLPRNVMMTRINIPNSKRLNIYNTHLCSACTEEQFSAQMDVLLPFIGEVEASFPQGNFAILGGDFNIDRFRVDPFVERFFYDRIINAGLIDAYAQNRPLDSLCANPKQPDAHCTVEVSTLDAGGSARRVDYIFMNQAKTVRESRVVFNTIVDPSQPSVSDHAGVFISVALP